MSRPTCIEHHVAEGWDELNRGVCPACGTKVVWDEEVEVWVENPHLVVIVLTPEEVEQFSLRGLADFIDLQIDLSEEF